MTAPYHPTISHTGPHRANSQIPFWPTAIGLLLALNPLSSAQTRSGIESAQELPEQRVEVSALQDLVAGPRVQLDRPQLIPWGERNAATALTRVPGVNSLRDDGDARFVVIRGIDPAYNAVTINGAAVAAGSPDTRTARLDGLELEGFEQIELTKVLMPDEPADAVGGAINFSSPSAFDYRDAYTEIGLDGLYDGASGDAGAGGYFRHGQISGSQNTGLFLSGSHRLQPRRVLAVESDPYVSRDGGFLPADEINFDSFDGETERWGGAFNWEQQLPQRGTLYLRGSYNAFNDTLWRQRASFEFEDALEADSLFASETGFRYQDDASDDEDDVGVTRQLRQRDTRNHLQLWALGGDLEMGEWQVDFALNYSAATEDEDSTDFAYEWDDVPDGLTMRLPTRQLPRFAEDAGIFSSSAGRFELDDIQEEIRRSDEDNLTTWLNLAQEFTGKSPLQRIKFGARFQAKQKENEVEVIEFSEGPPEFETLRTSPESLTHPLVPLPSVARDSLSSFRAARNAFTGERELGESVAGDFRSDEDIFAAYAMADWVWSNSTLTTGLRWEDTDFLSRSQSFDESTGTSSPVTVGRSVSRILPGIHFHRRSQDTLHSTAAWEWRAAYTQTLGRPGFEETKAGLFIEDDEIEAGNPTLLPLAAHNFDVSAAYERPEWGRFEVALFHKEIRDFIYALRRLTDFDADGELDELREFVNGPTARVSGVELAYQHTLWGEPRAAHRVDFNASATWADSEATYLAATQADLERELPFAGQADRLFRADLDWFAGRWQARLTFQHRSGYLDEIGEGTEDFRVLPRQQLDAAVVFRASRSWSVFARVENITREPFRAIWTGSERVAEWEDIDLSGSFGVVWSQ